MYMNFILIWAIIMILLNAWNFLFGIKSASKELFHEYRNNVFLIGSVLNVVLTLIASDPIQLMIHGYYPFQYIMFLWIGLLLPIVIKFLSEERDKENAEKEQDSKKI